MEVKFSIISATYNRPEYLKRMIKSVVQQSYKNFELIIVDDNSSYDNNINNKNVIESFCDDRIKYIHLRKNKKQCHARNVGLKVCSGNWIRYLDDDDYLLDNSLQEYYDFIVKNPNKKVFTTKYLCNNDIEGIDFNQIENIFDNWNVDTCCIIHHIDCYKKLGGWKENLQVADDYEFILRYVISYKKEYGFIDKVLAKFDFDENNSYLSNKNLNCISSMNYIYNEFCEYNKIMKLLIINVDEQKLIKCLYNLKCFFKIDLKSKIEKADLNWYDYIYIYHDGSLLKNIVNLTYHNDIKTQIHEKEMWINNKKRTIK